MDRREFFAAHALAHLPAGGDQTETIHKAVAMADELIATLDATTIQPILRRLSDRSPMTVPRPHCGSDTVHLIKRLRQAGCKVSVRGNKLIIEKEQ